MDPQEVWLSEPVEVWRTRWGLPALQIHQRVTSTNDLAKELALQGAAEGTTVMAEIQDRGRGRRGREWLAPPGSSLLASMVLRPRNPGAETLLSLRLGLAAARAIEALVPLRVSIKWPNDLLVDDLKVAGILCEGAVEDGRAVYLVAGIGINVHQHDHAWPATLRGLASSLESRARRSIHRGALAGRLVTQWMAAARHDSVTLSPQELAEFRERDALFGQALLINGHHAGVGQGIEPDGALLAGPPTQPRRIIAGTVRTNDSKYHRP